MTDTRYVRDPITGSRLYDVHYSYYDSSRPPSPRATIDYEEPEPVQVIHTTRPQPRQPLSVTNHDPRPLHPNQSLSEPRSLHPRDPLSIRKPRHLNSHEPLSNPRPLYTHEPVSDPVNYPLYEYPYESRRQYPPSSRVNPGYVNPGYADYTRKVTTLHQPNTNMLADKPPSYHSDVQPVDPLNNQTSESMRQKHRYINYQKIHKGVGGMGVVTDDGRGRWRKCVAVVCGILCVLLLIGAILGLYFGIKEAIRQQSLKAPENNVKGGYTGGYYVNGVYVVPVTTRPGYTYLIYGTETPCNPYNNQSQPNYPNCNEVTTRLQIVNWTTTTPRTIYIYARASSRSLSSVLLGLVSFIMILCARF